MKKIHSLILQPHIQRLENDFRFLVKELSHQPIANYHEEVSRLKSFIQQEIEDLRKLQSALISLENVSEPVVPTNVHQNFKRLKMALHLARRRRERLISNEARIRKIQERRAHVSTFAA